MSAEKIISFIKDCSDDEKSLDNLQTELTKEGIRDALAKGREKLEIALPTLSPQKHTLGIIHVMFAICQATKFDKALIVKVGHDLIINGSIKQIRFDPKRFGYVCKKYVELCRELKQPMKAIKPMKIAMNKVSSSPEQLTPQHTLLCLACIASKCYQAAIPTLDRFVYLIDPKQTGVTSEDTRLYYYYGGICYAAMKKWKNALEFFEIVISAPAMMPSAIMVEAYKKFILVSLILKGKVGNLPKSTNGSLVRIFKQFAQPYEDLATAFSTYSLDDVSKVIDNNIEPFTKDVNLGLVFQVRSSIVEHSIRNLTTVYSTSTFNNLTEITGEKDKVKLQSHLLRMAENGYFSAKIDSQKSYVLFCETEFAFDNDETSNYLRKHVHDTLTIHKQSSSIDREIEKSERYVQKNLLNDKFGDSDREMGMMGAF